MSEEDESVRVQWANARLTTTAGLMEFGLVVPHSIHEGPTYWLQRFLEDRIQRLFEGQTLRVALTPAHYWEHGESAGFDPGELVIDGMSDRWPDADKLKEAVGRAVNEAYAEDERVSKHAEPFLRRLWGTG